MGRRNRRQAAELEILQQNASGSEEDEDGDDTEGKSESEEEDELPVRKKAPGFAAMMMESDDESSSDESEDDEKDSEELQKAKEIPKKAVKKKPASKKPPPASAAAKRSTDDEEDEEDDDDFDALLNEFKIDSDEKQEKSGTSNNPSDSLDICVQAILQGGSDVITDLDIEHVMRTSLVAAPPTNTAKRRTRSARAEIFGPVASDRDTRVRPPHYVGGGLGMTTYDQLKESKIPWPYSDQKASSDSPSASYERWFAFTHSDSYVSDLKMFQDNIQNNSAGDPNALCMFVAQFPFIPPALLQLSTILYQLNHSSHDALSLLKRSLWVYDCAALASFRRIDDGCAVLMDHERPENNPYFEALFRLVRASRVAGLIRTSLAVSRYILSLDPLRDPYHVLLAIDHFVLQSHIEQNDTWLINFVESRSVSVLFRDDISGKEYSCDLSDLPNWSYSYALALYRQHKRESAKSGSSPTDIEASGVLANTAIAMAVKRFPPIVDGILQANDTRISAGRSMRPEEDWPTALEYTRERAKKIGQAIQSNESKLPATVSARLKLALEKVSMIFVQQNHKLWDDENVLKWLCGQIVELKKGDDEDTIDIPPAAMIKYLRVDSTDFADSFTTILPAEMMNPVDRGLIAEALKIDPNRPRMFQRMQRRGNLAGGVDEWDAMMRAAGNQRPGITLGPPNTDIDPDWPLMEIFWRSALPWSEVEGVLPPPPPPAP